MQTRILAIVLACVSVVACASTPKGDQSAENVQESRARRVAEAENDRMSRAADEARVRAREAELARRAAVGKPGSSADSQN